LVLITIMTTLTSKKACTVSLFLTRLKLCSSVCSSSTRAVVVKSADEKVIEYFDQNGADRKLRLGDYDDITVLPPNLKLPI